jgi:hypothetical protein
MSKSLLAFYLQEALHEKLNRENSNKERIKFYPHTSLGKVVYAPSAKGVCDPTWVILECDKAIVEYYTWFLLKRGIRLEFPMWGSHLSVVRGELEEKTQNANWGYRAGDLVTFTYGDLVTNGKHWWLEVHSLELEELRSRLGITPHPWAGFHITLGKPIKFK